MKNSLKKVGGFFKNVGGFFKKIFVFKKDGKINLKTVVPCGVALVAIIVVVAVVIFTGGPNQESKLKNKLELLGSDFYENFYYEQIGSTQGEKEEFLAKFKDLGIKVNLDNLIRHKNEEQAELQKEFVNEKTNQECNAQNTKVVIYPKESYGKKDYKIEVILDCGFETDNTK